MQFQLDMMGLPGGVNPAIAKKAGDHYTVRFICAKVNLFKSHDLRRGSSNLSSPTYLFPISAPTDISGG